MNRKNNLLAVGKVLLFWALCMLFLVASSALTADTAKPAGEIASVGLAALATLALTLVYARWGGLSLAGMGAVPSGKTLRRLGFGLLVGSVLASLQPALVIALGPVSFSAAPTVGYSAVVLHLVLYLLVACREELAFRGYPLRYMDRKFGPLMAQLVIAVVFIVEHRIGGMSWPAAIMGSGTGAVFFGIAALKTRGLALPIGLHASWNFVQWCWGFKPEAGIGRIAVAPGFEAQAEWLGWASYLLVMLTGIGFLAVVYRGSDPGKMKTSKGQAHAGI
ncbi:CPBP family intramembrane glutamic endopeptidase [Parapedobacter lycopersici]|uniref:CPBP family intramembrane glutamic endopeptidase n=1 Tax=Parapedobacter lycopersici TaxID=1864939 RepID=UPI00333EAC78